MKMCSGMGFTTVLAMAILGGCAMNPHHADVAAPAIKVMTESHNISAGTTTRVTAETVNVVGGSDIQWSVTPNVARICADGQHGTTALFTSDQEGTYVVKGSVNLGNAGWVSDEVQITVHGISANGKPVSGSDMK